MHHSWDPDRYLAYADERGRPFVELLARVPAAAPALVVDLGCGPGGLTGLLAARWPAAEVVGVDSSAAMVERARTDVPGVRFEAADLRDWLAGPEATGVDVLVSNATLQWLPGHLDLLPALVGAVAPGGWLALQVPASAESPSHRLLRALAAEAPYAEHTAAAAHVAAHDAATYLAALADLGCEVDAWETTYHHVLTGRDPVLAWVSGTGARPTLQSLPPALRARFETAYAARLRAAYPSRVVDGREVVVYPFRRVFVVARAPLA